MGFFSWIYSDINKQLMAMEMADTYLLVPEEFQDEYGKYIKEGFYQGYGRFGGYDIYDLIPEWNKEMIPEIIDRIQQGKWECTTDKVSTIKNLRNYYEGKPITCELRWLGIVLACYDEDNESLKYPIKITSKPMEYKDVTASKTDPNQGWWVDDED